MKDSYRSKQFEILKNRIYESFGSNHKFVILEHFTTVSNSYTDEFAFAIVDEQLQCIYMLADVVSTIDKQKLISRAMHIPTVYGYLFVSGESRLVLDGEFTESDADLFSTVYPIDFQSNLSYWREGYDDNAKNSIKKLQQRICQKYGLTKEWANQFVSAYRGSLRSKPAINSVHIKKGERLYRYLSNDAFFRIIDSPSDKKILTYGLSSICSMNDQWEYSFGTDTNNNRVCFRDSSVQDTHIMSLSKVSPCESLDMWRLYGDDAKGICLEFEVESNAHVYHVGYKKGYQGYPFFPFYIKSQNGSWFAFPLKTHTPEQIFSKKSYDYVIEREARLIVINGKANPLPRATNPQNVVRLRSGKWVCSSGTPFPMLMMKEWQVVSQLDDDTYQSPLILKRVLIGPNASDSALKKAMIIKRLSELGVNASVEIVKDFGYKPTK